MIRRLLVLCTLVALASQSAYGVELGKIQLHSALNQRLNADIPLTNVEGLGTDEILPGLASPEEFDRMGIDRPFSLTDLRFTVQQGQNGRMTIHITSSKPIVEPYLDFLMQVLWPNGRIVREYTVLLNPPTYGKSGIQKLTPPAAASQSMPTQTTSNPAPAPAKPAATMPQPQTSQPSTAGRAPVNPLEQGSISNGQYGVTGPGDTLWQIAAKVRPNRSVSIQQTMLAIKRANPEAFIHDNINLLKAGKVLRIPNLQAIQRETLASAVQEVKAQNAAFHAYKNGGTMPQINASPRNSQASGSSGGKGANGSGELRLLTAKGASNASRASANGGTAAAKVQALQDQLDTTRESLDKAKSANTDLSGRVTDLQQQIKTLNHLVKLKDDQLAALRAAVQKMQKSQANNLAATTASSPKQQGSLLTNPYVLTLLGVILVGGVAGGLIFMRRRQQVEDDEPIEAGEEEAPAAATEVLAETEDEAAYPPDQDDEELSPQTSDVISEAEIYIAYGRFPQAITFLQNAIEAEPTRADIRLKLLEVYAQTEDADAFNQQFGELEALGNDGAVAQAQALRRQLMGEEAVANEQVGVGGDGAATENEDEELSFDLDDLDAETEDTAFDLSDELDLEEEMDLDPDAGGASDLEEETEPTLSLADDDLDLDLAADSSEEEVGKLGAESEDAASSLEELSATLKDSAADDDENVISLDEADIEDADLDLAFSESGEEELDDGAIELPLDDEEDIDLETESGSKSSDLTGSLSLDEASSVATSSTGADDIALNFDDDLDLDLDADDEDVLDLDFGAEDDTTLESSDAEGLDLGEDDEFELNLDEDASTKLDLARAYIDMGDSDGARSVLNEVIEEGSDNEVQEAHDLLAKID